MAVARSTILILCFTALVAVSAKTPWPETDFGLKMSAKAYENVCWYENLKQLHNEKKGMKQTFLACTHQVDALIKELEPHTGDPGWNEKFYQENVEVNMGPVMNFLTPDFQNACGKYLKDANMASASDESEVLQDSGKDYPFKGFAHCLINELRTKYGQKAIDAVVEEKVKGKRDFRTVMLERENEYRTIHGVKPYEIDTQLNKDAQEWAENLAERCYSGRDPHDHRDQTKAKHHGENIARGGQINGENFPEDIGYNTVNSWYSEIDNYNFATGKSKNGKAVGHFTQTVWKNSERAGYGYKYNSKCPEDNRFFVVARYSPGGNVVMNGVPQHTKNVFKPKH